MAKSPQVGDRLSYDGAICTVRYVGQVSGTTGSWLGVEWDDQGRGKHDGAHKGTRYFSCLSPAPNAASFVRPTRPADRPQSFVQALQDKYTAELSNAGAIQFSGKVAEEVGFEKIRKKQARLSELKYVVLDGACIKSAYDDGDARISETCPKVIELDLSRNLFQTIGSVIEICSDLTSLRNLRLNGNRFQGILEDDSLAESKVYLQNVQSLTLEETLMNWQEICHVATKFPVLSSLSASTNQLGQMPEILWLSLASTLTSINLEFNDFTAISQVASLAGLTSLRNLHLKGNSIAGIRESDSEGSPVFSDSLQYLDVSYNQISSWSFIDDLPACFPGLVSLRFAHNPIYDNPDPEHSANSRNVTEEAYMFVVGRLPSLKTLNFGAISNLDRQNAEAFYLSRIGKHLAAVPETQETEVIQQHRRYRDLCEIYGPPVVSRVMDINPAFLEARLVTINFLYHPLGAGGAIKRVTRIPRSFDIYAVKGIAGKLFGVKPLDLRLVWETGEWDPVAGFDDEVEDSDDEGDEVTKDMDSTEVAEGSQPDGKAGKWVKREVELQDGPRQLGFCVDGLEAEIRAEVR